MYKKKKKNVKKFRKRFNIRIIKAIKTYSIEEITELFGVHKSTICTWLKTGLKKIDTQQPYLIWGQDLIDFLNTRNADKKRPCAENELFCCKCQKATRAKNNRVRIHHSNERTNLVGICDICESHTNKTISPSKIDSFLKIFQVEGLE